MTRSPTMPRSIRCCATPRSLRAALARLDAGDTDAAKGALETLAAANGAYRNTARLDARPRSRLRAKDYAAAGKWLDEVVGDAEAPASRAAHRRDAARPRRLATRPASDGAEVVSAKVAIIGRPNVGKSTLFNRLVGRKLALVDDQPGVTRDRREGEATLGDLEFTVIDTAGLEEGDAGNARRPHARADRDRARRLRRDPVPHRRARRA